MLAGMWAEMRKGDLLEWADALGVATDEVSGTLRPLVRECRELLNDIAKLRGRIHRVPDRDVDLAFMAMERNLTFVNQALGHALVDAGREVGS
jgi:uncharacterized sporulation protein YeaH/YhbH (DUF444 family)